MNAVTADLKGIHTKARTPDAENSSILDAPMPAYLGKGSNNTLRHQTPATRNSVLEILEFHTS